MTVTEYLAQLPGTESFLALPTVDQDKWIFQAQETLNDQYSTRQITERVIALQTIYMFEGESEDFAVLKRHGVETFSTEGLSVSFKSGSIAPQVVDIITRGNRAGVGSII